MSRKGYFGEKDWHSAGRLFYTLNDLNQTHGKPNETVHTLAMNHLHEHLLPTIMNHSSETEGILSFERIEATSCFSEGLAVKSSPIEFNVLVIASGGENLDRVPFSPRKPGFAKIRVKPGFEAYFWEIQNPRTGYLNVIETQKVFREQIKTIIARDCKSFDAYLSKMDESVLRMEVGHRYIDYSVNLALGFEITDSHGVGIFATRPLVHGVLPDTGEYSVVSEKAWSQSFAINEKEMLENMDKDKGCRRRCARLFKVICYNNPVMNLITPYMVKTTLFHLMKRYSSSDFWMARNIGKCLVAFILEMASVLEYRTLWHFFIECHPSLNLLEGGDRRDMANAATFLRRLGEDEAMFYAQVDALRTCHTPIGSYRGIPSFSTQPSFDYNTHYADNKQEENQKESENGKKAAEGNKTLKIAVGVGVGILGLGAVALAKLLISKGDKKEPSEGKEKEESQEEESGLESCSKDNETLNSE